MADPADDPDNDARASAAVAEPEEQDAQQQPQAPRGGVPVGPQQAPGTSQADVDQSFAAAGYGKPSAGYTGGPLAPPGTPDTPQVQSPEDRYKEAYGAADKQFSDAYFKANPFKTSFDLPDTPRNWYAAAERAQDQKDALAQRQAQIAERQQALQQRQQRVATATQRENDMRANGQKFFRDPEGNIQPVLEPGTGRPIYDKTPWEEGVDPKTGAPALAMTDQYGQRQFKSFPIVPGGDPNDTQLYYRMPDGTTKPAGDAADLAKSPDYQTAKAARETLKNVHKNQWNEALSGMAEVVGKTKDDIEQANQRLTDLQSQSDQNAQGIAAASADPNLNETQGIFDSSPSDKSLKAQAQLTMLQRQQQAIENERQGLTASLKKGGQLYETNAEAKLQYAIHQDLFRHGAYQHAIDQRAAAITHAGGDPAKDPILQQLQIAQANHASGAASGVTMSAQRAQQRQANPPVAPALPGTPPPDQPPPAGPAAGGAPPAPGSSPAPAPGTPAAPPPSQTGTPTPPPGPAPLVDRFAQTQQGKQPVGILGALISANQRAEKPLPMIGSESAGTKGGLFTIPKVYGTGAIPGILNAANEFTAGLTSPENAALLATTGGAGVVGDIAAGTRLALTVKGAQVAALAGFTAQGAGDTIEKTKAAYTVLHDPKATRADKAKAVAAAILSGAVTAAGAHGTRELATAPKGRVMPESPAAEFHPEAGTDQTGRAAKPTVVPTAATPPPAAPPAAAPPAGEQPSNPATAPGSTPLQPTHAEFTDNSPEAVAARAKANEPQMDPELRAELLKQGVHPPEAPAAAKGSLPPDAKVTYLGKKEPVLKGVGQPEDHWQVALPGEPRGVTVTRSELEKQGIDVSKLPTDEAAKQGEPTNAQETVQRPSESGDNARGPAPQGEPKNPQAVRQADSGGAAAVEAEPPRGNVAPQPDEGAPREGGVSPERGGAPREDVPNAPADARGAERPAEPAGASTPAGGDSGAVGEGVTPKKGEPTWQKFPASEKSLDVPRGEMPQVKSEDRPALVDALKEKGIASKNRMMKVADLKPTQAEFSPEKVQAAREHKGSDRKILVSKDGYIVDGHHQWMADKQDGSDNIPVTQIDAPIRKLLPEVSAFEKAKTGEGPKETRAPEEQPHAVVEKDGKDTKITPTPHAEAAVSKLATPKQIKAQKAFLQDAVAEALKTAKPEADFKAPPRPTFLDPKKQARYDAVAEKAKDPGKVTFSVPGDGEYKIRNTKEAITEFQKRLKSFGGSELRPPTIPAKAVPKLTPEELAEHKVEPEVPGVTTPEKGVVSGSKAEAWADKVIKAGQGKVRSGVSPSEFAAFAVKGVAIAERGVRDFAKWSAEMVKEFGDKIRPHLQDLHDAIMKHAPEEAAQAQKPEPVPGKPGKFYRSLPDTERSANENIVRQVYERRSQKPDLDAAQAIIDHHGPEKAMEIAMARADDGVPYPVKTAIYVRLAKAANDRLMDAKTPEEAAQAIRDRNKLSAIRAPHETEVGQGTSMLQNLQEGERHGAIERHLSDVAQEQDRKLGSDGKKALDESQKAIEDAKEEAIEKASDEIRDKLRTLKIGKPAWEKYREDAGDRIVKMMESPAEAKEQPALKEFTDRVVAEVKGRLKEFMPERPESAPPPTPGDILREALDNKERYGQVLTSVRNAVAKKFGEGTPPVDLLDTELSNLGVTPWSERILTKAVKGAHDAMGEKVSEIAREHLSKTDRKAGDIANALVKDAGISGPDATRLESDLTDRAKELYAAARDKALDDLKKRFTNKGGAGKVFSAVQKAVKLSNLGAMDRADLHDAVVSELGLPKASPERVQKIGQLADKVERAPDAASRARATLDLATELHDAKNPSKMGRHIDTATSLWYANMLSGTTVPIKALGDITNGMLQLATTVIANPAHAGDILKGWASGVPEGLERFASVMKTGRGSIDFDALKGGDTTEKTLPSGKKTVTDPRPVSALENVKDKPGEPVLNKLRTYPQLMKYVPRAFRAIEAMFAVTHREAYARLAATKLLEGQYKGAELAAKVKETLGVTPQQFEVFRQRAEAEGFKGADAGLRVAQMVEEHREGSAAGREVNAVSDKYMREGVYAQEPTGLLGMIYRVVSDAVNSKVKVAGIPILKPVIPFMRTLTNMVNESVNYTPWGAKRALHGQYDENRVYQKPEGDERNRLLVKSAAGTMLMGSLYNAAVNHDPKDHTGFAITGAGPSDYAHATQLRQQGERAHSWRIAGKWYNYMNTPLAVPLSIIGNMADAHRFQKQKGELLFGNKGVDAVASALGRSIIDQPMLEGLSNMAELASGKTTQAKIGRFLASSAASAAIPADALVRQIDQAFDPRTREASSLGDIAKAQIPFERRSLPVRTDALGDAITYSPGQRFVSTEKNDPLRRAMSDRNIAPSEPERQTKLGNRTMTDKEYNFYKTVSGRLIKARLDALRPGFYGKTDAAVQNEVRRVEETERKKVREQIGRMAGVH